MDIAARDNAMRQWNTTACGQMDGDQSTCDYFDKVEQARRKEQSWMYPYFNFSEFKNKKILEIGVGQGTDLLQFAKAGAECYGIDITDNHLNLAQRNLALHGYSVDLRKSDAVNIKHEDNFFDCVYSFGVLHHIPEIEKCIKEIKRVLKPGGKFFFAVYNKWSVFHLVYKLWGQGICDGQLFKLGYEGLISTIECGADGINIKPYVKLYSKRELKGLMRPFNFDVQDVSIHQLYITHFTEKTGKILRPFISTLENTMGWYIACKATKK